MFSSKLLLALVFVGQLSAAADIPVVLRQPTGGKVAVAFWIMPDNTVITVRVKQGDYDEFAINKKGVGEFPGKPDSKARFMLAWGGMPALNTVDGYPNAGDAWEETLEGIKVLRIATSDKFDWNYKDAAASDPGAGLTSQLTGIEVKSSGNAVVLTTYDILNLPLTIPDIPKTVIVTPIDETIPNHKSVSFDAQSNGSFTLVTSVTISHTVTNTQSNLYIGSSLGITNDSAAPYTCTYKGVSLNAILAQATGGSANKLGKYFDLANNQVATGANNIVWSWTNNAQGGTVGTQSAYGVNQSTPRTTAASAPGNDAAPTQTIASATGELVLTNFIWRSIGAITDTVDGTWTQDYKLTSAGGLDLAGAHLAGAASVTRTDTLSGSANWAVMGVALKAATVSSVIPKMPLMGVGP